MLEEMKVAQTVACLNDGKSAIEYLQNSCCNPSAAANACPDLIFLDLNMPGVDGFEVLEKLKDIKGCESLSAERVVVLTTSMHQKDLEKANNYNVYGYLIKPLTETKINGILEGYVEHLQQKATEQKEKPAGNLPPDRQSSDRPTGAANSLRENKLNK